MLVSAAIELFAAAVGRHVALWRTVPLPHGHDGRILVLLLVLAGSVALVALALRGSPAPLVLNVEGGSRRLPPDTLERFLADELATDPDVVSTRAWFALREGRLAARFSVAVRPLASVPALRERLAAKAVTALRDELGLEADVADPAVKVLRVRELPRYLRS
jgi:hypothetical protein